MYEVTWVMRNGQLCSRRVDSMGWALAYRDTVRGMGWPARVWVGGKMLIG